MITNLRIIFGWNFLKHYLGEHLAEVVELVVDGIVPFDVVETVQRIIVQRVVQHLAKKYNKCTGKYFLNPTNIFQRFL